MRSAVLFLVFNRPDTTARVFAALRRARPPKLYIAADGPRASRTGEAALCERTRAVATAVDWPCEVFTLLRDSNLGCRRAVSSAISWFFECEPEGIVLEDDCLPEPSFFAYCDELLERYRDNERVMCISGDNFISSEWKPNDSYYFSRYAHIWGWASWARAWKQYRVDLSAFGEDGIKDALKRSFPESKRVRDYWMPLLIEVAAGRIDTWDYQWMYALWRHDGLSCMPRVNLISNIGFGAGATHTTSAEGKLANLPAGELRQPLTHPDQLQRSVMADAWTEEQIFEISARNAFRRSAARVMRRFRTALKGMQRTRCAPH